MAAYQSDSGHQPAVEGGPCGTSQDGTDAIELIAAIRQLAQADPAGVQQVVADVLTALDRAAGGTLRDQLPDGLLPGATAEGARRPSDASTSAT